MCYPTEKANETEFFFLSRAGLNSSEAINVLTSRDFFDMSLHKIETKTLSLPKTKTSGWEVLRQLLS